MGRAFLFAVLFVLAGLVSFAFIAPLLFHSADFKKLGQGSAPFIVLIFGSVGFILGWISRKK
jgi:hypothetical protein